MAIFPTIKEMSEEVAARVLDEYIYEGKTLRQWIDVLVQSEWIPAVTPKQKTGKWIKLKDQQPEEYKTVLVKDIDGFVTCARMCDDIDFFESFSGEYVDDVVEWMEMPK